MTKRLASILLLLGLAACGGKSAEPATTPTGGGDDTAGISASVGPTCAEVAANVKAQLSGNPDMPADKADQAAEALGTSCTEDAWSEEARKCGAEATADELEECKAHLPADVAAKLDARMEAIFDGG